MSSSCAFRWPPAPQPGDFAVVPLLGPVGTAISAGEDLAECLARRSPAFVRNWQHWDHAFLYLGGNQVGEAAPGGFRIRSLDPWGPELYGAFARWSSGTIALTAVQRVAAVTAARQLAVAGTGYGWADYAALTAHDLHLPVPGLQSWIASSGTMICSQAVDWCYLQAGAHLFRDGRWPGYVTPLDLADLVWNWPDGVYA